MFKNSDFINILYYIFIMICIISAILSIFFQTNYLLITGVASIGIATIRYVNKK